MINLRDIHCRRVFFNTVNLLEIFFSQVLSKKVSLVFLIEYSSLQPFDEKFILEVKKTFWLNTVVEYCTSFFALYHNERYKYGNKQ